MSSKSPAGQQSDFQESFSALVECLRKSFREPGTVSVPSKVIAPFRRSLQPTDNSLLRDLTKVLENGRPKNIVRLDSASFYHVAAVVFCFPHSAVQNKLLYIFMETVDQYKNESTFASILSRVHGTKVTAAEVREQGEYVGRKLSTVVLRHLVSKNNATEWRWRLAQFLSVLVSVSSAARDQVVQMVECQNLTTILVSDQSQFLRVLVADCIRVLLVRGAERTDLAKSPTSRKALELLPLSKTVDSKWINEIVEHLSRIDAARTALGVPDRLFIIQRLECDGNPLSKNASTCFAAISNEIFFLLPGAHFLLVSVPILRTMSVNRITSESDTSTILEMRYLGDEGDRFVNGARSAISGLAVTFCDEEDIDAFTKTLDERRSGKVLDEKSDAVRIPKKQSMAVIDISSDSASVNEDQNHAADIVVTSEVDASSPLRNISLRSRQKKGSATAISGLGADSGEDTPALKKAPDSRQLIQRLRASQDETADSNHEAKPSSRQSHLRRSPRKLDSPGGKSRQATSPHLPAAARGPSQPPAAASSSKSKSKSKRPAEPTSTSLSNQAKKRSKLAANTGQVSVDEESQSSGRKRGQGADTMARLTGASQVDSQATVGATKTGLKRRANKESVTSKAEESQRSTKAASVATEFDFPPSDDADSRPAKKAKTKTNKSAVKAAAKAPAEKKKGAIQVAASPKGAKKTNSDKPKAKKSQEKKPQTTMASSRIRRAAKTPKYIEDSDDSGVEDADEDVDNQQENEDNLVDDDDEEAAGDSYPLDKEILEAAMEATQHDFESQLLPGMVEELSTDDEAESKAKASVHHPASKLPAATNQHVDKQPSDKQKQSASKKENPVARTISNKAGSDSVPAARKPSEKAMPSDSVLKLQDPQPNQPSPEKDTPAPIPAHEQIGLKEKPRVQDHSRANATPQHNTKRLSESSILPASEKLLRKTPIVHFGPQGPVNQAVQPKIGEREVAIGGNANNEIDAPSPLQVRGKVQLKHPNQHVRDSSPEPQLSTTHHDTDEDDTQDGPAGESYELAPPSEPAMDIQMEDVDEPARHPSSEAVPKSPEINETQPRTPEADHHTRCPEAEVLTGNAITENSKRESVGADDESSVGNSHNHEASEYLESEVEEVEDDASLQSLQVSEAPPSRKPEAPDFRPQTPLLDDEAPGRGYQRTQEAPVLRQSARQSIGVSAILDDGYPTAPRALKLNNLRPVGRSAAGYQANRASVSTSALSTTTQISKRSDQPDSANAADSMQATRKSKSTSVTISTPTTQGVWNGKSNEHSLTNLLTAEGTHRASLHAIPHLESAARVEKASVAKLTNKTSTRTDLTNMSAASSSFRAPLPMAPPPLPNVMPTRVTSKPDPRKSWPESRVEKKKRLAETAGNEKPAIPEPVRVKKRLTLPLAADEQLPEPDLPPATPASLSTRLELHADLPSLAAHHDEDSMMEDVGQKLGNGSMTLINEEQSVHGDRPGMWIREGRRRRSESADDAYMSASPSRRKGHAVGGSDQMVASLKARKSQQDLLKAIFNITNDVMFRLGAEEDAIKAKVDEYDRGGTAIVETLLDTWTQRIEHEQKIVADSLKAEKEFLSSAVKLVAEKHTDGAWREVCLDKGLLRNLQDKGAKLARSIEALTKAA